MGPKFATIHQAEYNECGAHPSGSSLAFTARLADLAADRENPLVLSTAELLGQQGEKAVKKDEAAAQDDDCPFNDTFPASVTVIRKNGHWVLKGTQSASHACGDIQEFDIHMPPPKSLVGLNMLFPTWKHIGAKVPDAVDAISSPYKDFLVVLTLEDIKIYRMHNGELGPPVRTIHLWLSKDDTRDATHTLVMNQWALGRFVSAWDEEVKRQKGLRQSDQP